MKKFSFKKFFILHLGFPKNGFNSATQNFAKSLKMLFPNAQNIRFYHRGRLKKIIRGFIRKKFDIKRFNVSPGFP